MASFKERIEKWKLRKPYQKAGDILFWLFLIALIIPGPRKFVATGINKVFLHFKKPSIRSEGNMISLKESDYIWDIHDASGKVLSPDMLKGKVIFLNFWGTYCPPCLAELPDIQRIYNDYGNEVLFVPVTSESPSDVEEFFTSKGYSIPAYFGGRVMPEKFSVRSIPTTFIISPDGKIAEKKTGAVDWDSKATRRLFDKLLLMQSSGN